VIRRESGKGGDDYESQILVNRIPHHQGGHDTYPDLTGTLRQVHEGITELRVDAQTAVDLPERGEELGAVATLPRAVGETQQFLPHSF